MTKINKIRAKILGKIEDFVKKQFPNFGLSILFDRQWNVDEVYLSVNTEVVIVPWPEKPKSIREIIVFAEYSINTLVRAKLEHIERFIQNAVIIDENNQKFFLWFPSFPTQGSLFRIEKSILIDKNFEGCVDKTILLIEKLKRIFRKKIFDAVIKNNKNFFIEGFQVVSSAKNISDISSDTNPIIIPSFLLDTLFEVNSLDELKRKTHKIMLEKIFKTWE